MNIKKREVINQVIRNKKWVSFFQTDKGLYGISKFSRPFKSSIEIQEKFNNFRTTFYVVDFYSNHYLSILGKFGFKLWLISIFRYNIISWFWNLKKYYTQYWAQHLLYARTSVHVTEISRDTPDLCVLEDGEDEEFGLGHHRGPSPQ